MPRRNRAGVIQEEAKEWLERMAAAADPAMQQLCTLYSGEFDRMYAIHKANVGVHKTTHYTWAGNLKIKGTKKTPTRRSLYDCLAGCRQVANVYDFYDDFVPHTSHGVPFLFPVTVEGAWRYGRTVVRPALQLNSLPESQRGPQTHKWKNRFLKTPLPECIRLVGRCVVLQSPGVVLIKQLRIKVLADPAAAARLVQSVGTPTGALRLMKFVQKVGKVGQVIDLRPQAAAAAW